MDAICIAIRSNGEKCNKRSNIRIGDGTRCGVHHNSLLLHGPNTMALMQLKYIFHRDRLEIVKKYIRDYEINQNEEARAMLLLNHTTDIRRLKDRYITENQLMRRIHVAEILRTGVNPDAAALERRQQVAAERRQRRFAEQEALRQRLNNEVQRIPPPVRDLGAFAADPQNVHTTEAVKHTKEIVERVRRIPVPEGYQWNTAFVSKTIGEIISDCQLSSRAAAQMFNQYVSSVAVYDIEIGIYGKVLDSVWQYVKASPDKADLCMILKQEMTDNVGMCAQGNLSRICNILAGYMDGVGSQESVSERLGRLLPPLMEIEDIITRLTDAFKILKENGVPVAEWDSWVDPLIDEDDMTVDIEHIRQGMIV